ncbi:MAG: hypothetical protein ABEI39_04000 [Halobacteriales archaeon]
MTYPRRFAVEGSGGVCLRPSGCLQPDLLPIVIAVAWVAILALTLVIALVHVRSARSVLEEERRRTRAERDAFQAFSREVASIDAAPSGAATPAQGSVASVARPDPDRGLAAVRAAYEETVMETDHYEAEYDEPIEVNMAAEFGEEVASAVAEGQALTPQLREALITGAREARDRRDRLLDRLDREAENLEETTGRLADVESHLADMNEHRLSTRSFDELTDAWDRLDDLEEECRAALRERQRAVHGDSFTAGRAPTIQSYLYQPLDVTYPVLAAGTDLVGKIRAARDRVATAVSRRA